jgi:ABC-type sugar transport system ATPase subunit
LEEKHAMANDAIGVNAVDGDSTAVICITHNVRHAYVVGNRFTVLNRGKTLGILRGDDGMGSFATGRHKSKRARTVGRSSF